MDMASSESQTLTRQHLREAVYEAVGTLSREQAATLTETVFEEIILAALNNEEIKLRGFGTFKIQHKKERIGRNPRNGIDALIAARRVMKFKPSPFLIAIVNGKKYVEAEED